MPQTSPTIQDFVTTFLARRERSWNANWWIKVRSPILPSTGVRYVASYYKSVVGEWLNDKRLSVLFSKHPTEAQCVIINEIVRQAGVPYMAFKVEKTPIGRYSRIKLRLNGDVTQEREFVIAQDLGAMAIAQQFEPMVNEQSLSH